MQAQLDKVVAVRIPLHHAQPEQFQVWTMEAFSLSGRDACLYAVA